MRAIQAFEVINHGVEHEQYFPGCGLSHTPYEAIATGCGDSFAEAVADALAGLAQQGWETEGMEKRICAALGRRKLPSKRTVRLRDEDCHHYVSIRVR